METHADVVIAAEALRTWVRTQRTSWDTDDAAVRSAVNVTAPPPPMAVPPPFERRDALFEPVEALPEPPAPVVAEPTSVAAPDVTVGPSTSAAWHFDAGSGGLLASWPARIAAGIALLALVGGGAYWQTQTGPRIGSAAFASEPAGAQVFVDGKPVGTTPVTVELNPGPHAVEFKLKDATRTQTIAIVKGREVPVNVDWNQRRVGGLQVNSTPSGAKVLVDGHERGRTPFAVTDVAVGAHTVVIESSEGTVRRRVDVSEGHNEVLTESIYPGWVHISAPVEVSVLDGNKAVLMDDSNRVLLKPGSHTIRLENRELDFSVSKTVEVEPGDTTRIAIEVPTSTLSVTGSAGAEVFVDGAKAGEIPLVDFQTRLGSHDVMVVDKSGATRHASVTVTTKPARLNVDFASR